MTSYAVARFNRVTDNRPKPGSVTWERLCQVLTRRAVRPDKDGPLFSPAEFRPGTTRANENVLHLSLFVGDFDTGVLPEKATAELDARGLAYACYSSHNHSPEKAKFRIVLPLAAPVPGEDWPRIHRNVVRALFDGLTDPACTDSSRMYYLPSCPPESQAFAFAFAQEGAELDACTLPDAPQEPAQEFTPVPGARPASGSTRRFRIESETFAQIADVVEAYNARGDHQMLLQRNGWTLDARSSREEKWRRPGVRDHHGATWGYGNSRILKVFTSSAPPLEARGVYTLFDLACLLEYGGDAMRCAEDLAAQGYGEIVRIVTLKLPSSAMPAEGDSTDSGPVEEPAEDSPVPPEPLIAFLHFNDVERDRIRQRGVKKRKVFEQVRADGIPEEDAGRVAEEIIVGKNLRRREDAKARDSICGLGKWYDGLDSAHGHKPYVVAKTFGLIYRPGIPYQDQHICLKDKIGQLQDYARLWRKFGSQMREADAPARLFREIAGIKDAKRREHWIREWTEGRGGRDEHQRSIYDRIRMEKQARREQDEAMKEELRQIRQEFESRRPQDAPDPETGEIMDSMREESHACQHFAAVPVPAEWAVVVPAIIAAAQEQGLTPEETLYRISGLMPEGENAPRNLVRVRDFVYHESRSVSTSLSAENDAQKTVGSTVSDTACAPVQAIAQEFIAKPPDRDENVSDVSIPDEDQAEALSALLDRLRDGRERDIGDLLDDGFPIGLIDSLAARGLLVKRRDYANSGSLFYRLAGTTLPTDAVDAGDTAGANRARSPARGDAGASGVWQSGAAGTM